MAILFISIHIVCAVIWVGGMFFALHFLRPVAVDQLPPPQRLRLWRGVFNRFFPWVWGIIIALPVSGYAFMGQFGFDAFGIHVKIMQVIGFIMIFVFLHVYFAPYKRLCRAIDNEQFPEGGTHLNQIRLMISINAVLGLILVAVAASGRHW